MGAEATASAAQVLGWATLENRRVSQRARKKRGAGNFSRASLPYALNFLRRLFIPPRLEADRFFRSAQPERVKKIS
jgi:hypothetical protein